MAKPATVFDVGRIDQSLAKGLLKRMLREGSANCKELLDRERTLRVTNSLEGKHSRGALFKRNVKLAKTALGNFLIDEICLTKPDKLGRKGKPAITYIIGLDTSMSKDVKGNDSALAAIFIAINYKTVEFNTKFLPVSISYHVLERLIERHQIRNMAALKPYLSDIVWASYIASEVADPGTNWVFTSKGMIVLELASDRMATALTWVPQEMWSVSQRELYERYGANNGLVITTSSYHGLNVPHRVDRPRLKGYWRQDFTPVVIRTTGR